MRFRTKLFLAWALSVLLPLAAIAWPLIHTLRDSFERTAQARFAGTRQSLAGVQAARVAQMRQDGSLMMNVPELRALIAESSVELSSTDVVNLQDRLDDLARTIDVRFACVLNARQELLAQNKGSPWGSLHAFAAYAGQSRQLQAMLGRLFMARDANAMGAGLSEEGLWVYDGGMYEMVGIPLIFGSDAEGKAVLPDGALIVAVPLTDEMAAQLSVSHDCQISFMADGRATASSLSADRRAELEKAFAGAPWPMDMPFDVTLGKEHFRSSLMPLIDRASGAQVGAMLIQTSTAAAEATEWRVLSGLTLLLLLAILGALLASYLLSGVIVRPVRLLVDGARSVAGGNLDTTLPVRRGDELGQLTVAFNDMVAGLRRQKELQTLVEESQAASKAKSRFLANMSHEIRTPLHGVIGMSELLLRTDMSERQRRYVGLLKSSAELLTKLINDVLDFSKAEAGKLELEAVDFDLKQIVEDAMELMTQRAHSKRLQLATEVSPQAATQVRGDPTRLRQILLNLLSNALKFTDSGSITLRVSCAAAGEQMLYKFEVQDTGMGIPRDRMNRLFQSFSQVDASTTRRFGGTGLGLAICKQLAELMGGQIGVESVEGKGSTFWFTARMQCRGEQAPAPAMVGKVCRLPYLQSKSLRVLLVEDQEINCIVASELLTEAGFAHDIVHDGKAAVDAVENGNYQLVLMDCQMPGMDGMEATRRIRAQERQNPARARVPIIALTANTSGADRDECVASGMDGFCSKPFTTQQLYDAIAKAVGDQPPVPVVGTKHEEMKARSDTKGILEGSTVADEVESGAPKGDDGDPPFDLQTVLARCSNKPALATMILDKFQAQATEALAKIQGHLAEGNAGELARASHAVKGTAGLLGAGPLRSAAARLEALGRQQTLGEAGAAVSAMQSEVDKCIEHIRTVKAQLDADATRGA